MTSGFYRGEKAMSIKTNVGAEQKRKGKQVLSHACFWSQRWSVVHHTTQQAWAGGISYNLQQPHSLSFMLMWNPPPDSTIQILVPSLGPSHVTPASIPWPCISLISVLRTAASLLPPSPMALSLLPDAHISTARIQLRFLGSQPILPGAFLVTV